MPNYEKALEEIILCIRTIIDDPEYKGSTHYIEKGIEAAYEALREEPVKPQNGSATRFYVEDDRGYKQYWGMSENLYMWSIQEAREAIYHWFDSHKSKFFIIYNEHDEFVEQINREPEDNE